MSNNPTSAAVAIRQLRTLEEAEASGKFVGEENSGIPPSTLYSWRTSKPPRLIEGKLVGDEIVGGDYFRELLRIDHAGTGTSSKTMIIYDRLALERCSAKGKANRVEKRKKWFDDTELIPSFRDEPYVRQSYVLRLFGIPKVVVQDWDERGWPHFGGEFPRRCKKHYYAKRQVDRAKEISDAMLCAIPNEEFRCPGCSHDVLLAELAKTSESMKDPNADARLYLRDVKMAECPNCQRKILIPDPPIYPAKVAAKRTRHAEQALRSDATAASLALVKVYFPVRIKFKHGKSKNRKDKQRTVTQCELGFTRNSVDAVEKLNSERAIPLNSMKLDEAWQQFRDESPRSMISRIGRTTVEAWCEEGLLDAKITEYLTKKGKRRGWIILNKSEKGSLPGVDDALAILRSVGWDTAAATIKLRALRDKRIADNNGQVPESRLDKTATSSASRVTPPDQIKSDEKPESPIGDEPKTRKTGRPKGSIDLDRERRKNEMIAGWIAGKYRSKAEAGRAHDFDRPDASKIINEYERS
jgi:hypothetical protein